jgi:hypothetical protein
MQEKPEQNELLDNSPESSKKTPKPFFTKSRILLTIMAFFLVSLPLIYRWAFETFFK